MMLRKLVWALLGAPWLVLLASCCGNVACTCQDLLADSLYFTFKVDAASPNAFTKSEIANIILTRYDSTQTSTTGSALTLTLPRNTRTTKALRAQVAAVQKANLLPVDTTGLLVISNNAPFPVASASSNLGRFAYELDVPQDSAGTFKKRTYTTFIFDRIRLNGRYQADGCCTCYQNLQKLVRVRGGSAYPSPGRTINATESGSGSERLPVIIQLSK